MGKMLPGLPINWALDLLHDGTSEYIEPDSVFNTQQ